MEGDQFYTYIDVGWRWKGSWCVWTIRGCVSISVLILCTVSSQSLSPSIIYGPTMVHGLGPYTVCAGHSVEAVFRIVVVGEVVI